MSQIGTVPTGLIPTATSRVHIYPDTMVTTKRKELSPLQAMVMKVLWDRGESTVAEVQQGLANERSFAHNTVATILTRLANDGVVAVRREGRTNVYKPVVAESTVKSTMVSGLLSRLFEGDASALVHHLVSEGELDPDELESLAKLIAARNGNDAR